MILENTLYLFSKKKNYKNKSIRWSDSIYVKHIPFERKSPNNFLIETHVHSLVYTKRGS